MAAARADASASRPPPDGGEPLHLLCPITHVMYQDPVLLTDSGNSYERWAILEHWRCKGQPHDPLTNMDLRTCALRTDWGKRAEVEEFLEKHPGYVPDGWSKRRPPRPNEDSLGTRLLRSAAWRLRVLWGVLPWRFLLGLGLVFTLSSLLRFAKLYRTVVGIEDDPGRLIYVLRSFPQNPWVQQNACAALANLAFGSKEKGAGIAEAGAIELIAAAMSSHAGHGGLQTAACAALANLAHGSSENSRAIVQAGGIARALDVLSRHRDDSRALQNACATLEKLAVESEDSRLAIVRAGGVLPLTQILRERVEDAATQRMACAVFEGLAIGGLENENGQVLVEAGGAELIVAAMRHHIGDQYLQGHCASALTNMLRAGAGIYRSRARVVEAGGIEQLLQAVQHHTGNSWVQGHACAALWALVEEGEESQRRFLLGGGPAAVVEVLSSHPEDGFVQRPACLLLRRTSSSVDRSFGSSRQPALPEGSVDRLCADLAA